MAIARTRAVIFNDALAVVPVCASIFTRQSTGRRRVLPLRESACPSRDARDARVSRFYDL
jgi:hypothetical protein